ncbi:DNA recombination and repair protein RecF [uncultured Gammaproteobacteria bacterium]|jgi:DNA replication and repair protein RecF|nr:DNA recombination and repair protein RecF [uncultured Gammaproteobacteria bacterium]CAC9556546.1 DNA recombination and repair protein RecF [uncultured Gammaproteobacteria bacterium]CAC9566394.1 DNA recombination and repair protein RecF [uncultured Gammaproteobacteria bacterium]CAC9569362.1 DNA recombination and repair protein RecF [uncultured Gammaproteobacteria bacterium]CAC9582338.1 DNA recombination and repair protein RecF [uncultured Gammaproteobacteria bacterium]
MAIINKLSIHQFRNLISQYITPDKNINLFISDNAQGKTNLIEAIYYLGHNRSFKTKILKEIINSKADAFQLSVEVDKNKIKLEKTKNKTNVTINQSKIDNASQLSYLLPIQIITPDKGFIVNGTPKNKRSYLDWGVFHVKPETIKAFKNYHKILKNINTLLGNNQSNELDFWFLELAKYSAIINKNRLDYLQQLRETLLSDKTKTLGKLIDSLDKFNYEFLSGWPKEVDEINEQNIYHYLKKNTTSLLRIKYLNYGSHKANINFTFDGRNECFFSRGEQKTLSIIFWLTQVVLLINLGVKPIVLIDDLSSELDNAKVNIILQYLKILKVQTFMTDINHNLSTIQQINPTIFQINKGVITQQK